MLGVCCLLDCCLLLRLAALAAVGWLAAAGCSWLAACWLALLAGCRLAAGWLAGCGRLAGRWPPATRMPGVNQRPATPHWAETMAQLGRGSVGPRLLARPRGRRATPQRSVDNQTGRQPFGPTSDRQTTYQVLWRHFAKSRYYLLVLLILILLLFGIIIDIIAI